MFHVIHRTMRTIENIAISVGGIALIAMMVAISASALSRHLLDKPIGGVFEVTIYYLMPVVVWLGLGVTERQHAHVRVEFVLNKFKSSSRRRVAFVVTRCITAAVILVIAISSVDGVAAEWGQHLVGAIELPVGPSRLLVTIGAGLFFIRLLIGGAPRADKRNSDELTSPRGDRK